jgi:hypothetical protein
MRRSILRLVVLSAVLLLLVSTDMLSADSRINPYSSSCTCFTDSITCRPDGFRRCAQESGPDGECFVWWGKEYHIERCVFTTNGDGCGRHEHFHNESCLYS